MLVILNKDASINYVFDKPEEIDNLSFNPDEGMSIVEMDDFKNTCTPEDYFDYFVINGNWVHFDEIDTATLGQGKPPELK